MDWQGQKLSEQIMQYLLLGSALVAFLTGYLMSSYRSMLAIYVIGVVLTFLLTVPEWPYFNRHSLQWAEPKSTEAPSSKQVRQSGKKSAKTGSKR